MEEKISGDDWLRLNRTDAWYADDAQAQMARSWPLDEPAVCDDFEGWTYSRILRHFPKEDKIVFRTPRSLAWLVFADRKQFARYCKFVLRHPSLLVK